MEFIYSIIAGIAGTWLMTLFMDLASFVTRNNFYVPKILGTMVTLQTTTSRKLSGTFKSVFWGYILHYAIGCMFAVVYFKLSILSGIRPTSYLNALVFGALAGIIAVVFWFCFIRLHPLPPKIKLGLYLTFIYLGHFMFALGMNWAFRLIMD